MAEPSTVSNDEHAERAGVDPTGGWHVSVARFLGRATGWATNEAHAVARRTTDVARSAFESSAFDAKRVSQLVRDLVELVTARAGEGYEALEHEPDFWRLVRELHEARARTERAKKAASDRGDAEASTRHEDVIDVVVAEPRQGREAAEADDESDDTPPTGAAEGAAPDGDGVQDSVQSEPRASRRKARKGDSE
jgi:hypothetical protein